jgi:hypothetical protein
MTDEKEKLKSEIAADFVLYIEIFDRFGPLGKPAIRISKFLSNKNDVEHLVKKALDDEAIIAKVIFKNKNMVVPRLARLGLIDPTKL